MKTIGNVTDDQKKQEFHDRMQSYNYLRQNRVSYWQAIYTALIISAILLMLDLITKYLMGVTDELTNIFIKILIIGMLLIFLYRFYKQSLIQTQKPIFVCENMIATVEGEPATVKGEDGVDYSVFKLSDSIHEEPKEEKKK